MLRNRFKHICNIQNLREWGKSIAVCVVVFAVAFIFFHTVILWGFVPSSSMEPTLQVGDIVVANGLAYKDSMPRKGDIVVFQGKEGDMRGKTLIKRVIGLPGDDVMFIDGKIYINGQQYQEEYLDENIVTDSPFDYEVPEDSFFVLGDNREHSFDSRFWIDPYVKMEDIKGKMIFSLSIGKILK